MRKIKCKPVFAGRFTRGTLTKRHLARLALSDHPTSPLKKLRSIAEKKLELTTALNEYVCSYAQYCWEHSVIEILVELYLFTDAFQVFVCYF